MSNIKNTKKIFLTVSVLICAVLATTTITYRQSYSPSAHNPSSPVTDDVKVSLNPLGRTGSDGEVVKVKISSSKDKFDSAAYAYEVINTALSEEQITNLATNLGITESQKEVKGDVVSVKDKKGNLLLINNSSGTIEYYSERVNQGKSDSPIDKQLTDIEYKDKADKFIKKLGLEKGVAFKSVSPSVFAEYTDENNQIVKKVVRVEAIYKKNPVDGIEFDGVGPGIKVEFDSSGSIVDFISVKKDIKKINKVLYLKNESEIIDAIKNKDAIISDVYGDNNEIELTECKVVLYSDPAQMSQEYMVPHYVFKGKCKGSDRPVSVIVNALKTKDYKIKN